MTARKKLGRRFNGAARICARKGDCVIDLSTEDIKLQRGRAHLRAEGQQWK